MTATTLLYRNQVMAELDTLPEEYLPFVVQLMRTFRESVTLKPAAASFQQGWQEAQRGEIFPIATLWDDIDAE
jgi:UDP-N-acetylmuramoylalanine-D-glutamate ligase